MTAGPLFRNILVPTDYGPSARNAATLACELAKRFDARVTLLHVVEVPLPAYSERITVPLDELRDAARDAMATEVGRIVGVFPEVESRVVHGLAWRAITDAVEEDSFDLVVLGTEGRHGLSRLLQGSVAEKVVQNVTVPVLTVHASNP